MIGLSVKKTNTISILRSFQLLYGRLFDSFAVHRIYRIALIFCYQFCYLFIWNNLRTEKNKIRLV